ncbi:hypothetical protein [Corallococcus caeni]|uniref:EGF-like domain-containing protein n=1 Tax=Corallococcus caeni TaxID=3082388 RepID=A0ABQ6QKY5_9BACT|nr:hypothetical protein ASNO1_09320 [Corallococcus sp. NO1]
MKRCLFGLAVLMALAGCTTGTHSCDTNADCPEGRVCIHEHAHDIDADTCQQPCADSSQCDAPDVCACPDSPSGTACRTDDGGFSRYCGFS